MNRRECLKMLGAIPLLGASLVRAGSERAGERPNILWIMAEDISTELACYGHPAVKTPHLDKLASQGVRYTHAFGTAPSCTPNRNAMITGVYQTRTDTQDQRRRGIRLPQGIHPITHYLRQEGYFNALGCRYSAKTDFNFVTEEKVFDGRDWEQRKAGQPFFAQITLDCTHRKDTNEAVWSKVRAQSPHAVDPAKVQLPPYFPDHPTCRLDWARYLDQIELMDRQVGEILTRLDKERLVDNTVVIFIGDNGRCHLRGKCWLYEGGLHIPLIVRRPNEPAPGTVCDDLVSTIDISATILSLAGVELPAHLDGRPFIGSEPQTRTHIFAARDLIDEVLDHIRCVRTKQFKYIRNYTPENGYRECLYVQKHRPMHQVIQDLHAQGRLTGPQRLLVAKRKPDEELYDLQEDPHEIRNLAYDPEHQDTLHRLRALLDEWVTETNDAGLR